MMSLLMYHDEPTNLVHGDTVIFNFREQTIGFQRNAETLFFAQDGSGPKMTGKLTWSGDLAESANTLFLIQILTGLQGKLVRREADYVMFALEAR